MINFCDRDEVKIECLKYLKHAVDLPINQESQLTFLLNQFQARDIQASFYKLIGEVGRVTISTFILIPSQKKTWTMNSYIWYTITNLCWLIQSNNPIVKHQEYFLQTTFNTDPVLYVNLTFISPFILEYQYSNFNKTLSITNIMGPRGAHCTASTSTAGRLRNGICC